MALNQVVVFGAGGAVGGLFVELLRPEVGTLNLFDASPDRGFAVGDVTAPPPHCEAAMARADLLLICVSDGVLGSDRSHLTRRIKRDCLVVECCSVMGPAAEAYESSGHRRVMLVNPLFAPDLGWKGQAIAIAGADDDATAQTFMRLVKSNAVDVVPVTADEHDHLMSTAQALVHATVISFGAALSMTPRRLHPMMGPPPYRLLTMLAARMIGGKPSTYWGIQSDNTFAAEQRRHLLVVLKKLIEVVETGDALSFARLFEAAAIGLNDARTELSEECRLAFQYLSARRFEARDGMCR